MPSEKIELLERIYGRWSEADFGPDQSLGEEFTLIMGADIPETGTYAGRKQVAAYMAGFLEPWDRLTIVPEEMTERGDMVLVRVLQSAAGTSSGIATELRLFNLWTFQDGAPVRMEAFQDQGSVPAEFET
jgi:ketosteroid isomerase-like protein